MGAVEHEILREKAAVLGRLAGTLEAQIAELRRLCARAAAARGPQRDALLDDLLRLRRDAERQRWYLVVQREALGLPDRGEVERSFPLPPMP